MKRGTKVIRELEKLRVEQWPVHFLCVYPLGRTVREVEQAEAACVTFGHLSPRALLNRESTEDQS